MIRMTVLGILCWVHAAAAGTHSLHFVHIATSEGTGFPEYMYVGMLDDVQISYYDSTMEKPVLRTHWSNKTKREEFLKIHTDYIFYGREVRKWGLRNLVQHFNHTGVHTYHNTGGCELDDDGTRRAHSSHSYDGKDFISIDVETMTWIAAVSQAGLYKQQREANTAWQLKTSYYYQQVCFQLLECCVQYGMGTLQRKVRPAVTLIQRKARESAGTDVICHVTGFYPREVEVNWIRDGEALLEEGVWSGEVLPNEDRTYQLRKILTVSPEDQKKHRYSCQVDHASLDEKMDVKWVPEAALNMGFVAAGVLAALGLIIAVIIGALIWKKRASANEQSDASSNLSNSTNNDRCDPIAEKLMTQTE
ncbi:major histocompatibility complex class I-related gene protein-like isoform X2 [Acipenser ruthenus]|uniref:major histocompatibility complex class I-related gene protein-like isoform X1 n=1 Tax=Acipenser ruthenus TaxID=7906 RepID=UPI00274211EB|nr:major histocompatibility complex class I-related gene protein-like isoform X1 [Acipenser ruthenus]XP_058866199.1 major histocompatibility complex class I-related gene protein-like isoform X2 [Acipenser ruthenus]